MIVLSKGNKNNYDKPDTHREMVKTNGIIEPTITWNKLQQSRQLQQSLKTPKKSHTPLCLWQVFAFKMSASVVYDNHVSHCVFLTIIIILGFSLDTADMKAQRRTKMNNSFRWW